MFNREKGGKVSAENVRLMRRGTIPSLSGQEEVLHGKVIRPLRSVNPDQTDYCGLIQVKNEDGSGKCFDFTSFFFILNIYYLNNFKSGPEILKKSRPKNS